MSAKQGVAPNIKSQKLNLALQKAKANIDNYRIKLDRITSDIKELEVYLRTSGITQKFEFAVAKWLNDPEEDSTQKPQPIGGVYWDYIVWEKHDDKIFRLMHVQYKKDSDGSYSWNFEKPLMESSVATRIRLFPHLDKFLIALSEAVAIKDILDTDLEAKETKDVEELNFFDDEVEDEESDEQSDILL
ncbi:MAG: hypothetical protein ACXWQQ_05185 [Pseudobdellovibrio sp.]